MSEIKNTASIAENSVLAKDKRGFPFRKVVFALLVALVVVSIILLVINLVINSYFSKVTVFDGVWEIDAEKVNNMDMYKDGGNNAYFNKSEELHLVYDKVVLNYAQATSDMKNDENVYNYAIFGVDQFEDSEKATADIIMLVSVNKEKDHVVYFSFETKMLVYIPGVGVGPMSDAFYLGGPQLLTYTIEQNYGIQLDGFVELNMTAFSDMIDYFGKIEFDADKQFVADLNADIDHYNKFKNLTGDDAVPHANLKKGKVYLNGQQTLAYMRRAGADKARISNSVLSQLTAQISAKGFGGIKEALDISLEKTTVSLLREDVGALIMIGTSVFKSIKTVNVGNMEGRTEIDKIGVICDYQAERQAIIDKIY